MHEDFKGYGCRYAEAAFVCNHILEDLVLLNHAHARLIVVESSDRFFLVGLGPNPVGFMASYAQGSFTFEELAAAIVHKQLEAEVVVDGQKFVYRSPTFALTYTNVQDTVCMIKKASDHWVLNFLAPKNKHEPKPLKQLGQQCQL